MKKYISKRIKHIRTVSFLMTMLASFSLAVGFGLIVNIDSDLGLVGGFVLMFYGLMLIGFKNWSE